MSMESLVQSQFPSWRFDGVGETLARMRSDEPRFFGLAVVLVVLLVPTLLAMVIDDRLFNGINIWEKPIKFEIALLVYLFTLALMARWLPGAVRKSRMYRYFSIVVCAAVVLEMVWIAGAAANGTGSHYNQSSPVMAVLYPVMGVLAVTLTSACLVYAVAIQRNRASDLDPAFRLSLVLGLGTTFFLTVVVAGTLSAMPGHWIGGPSTDAHGMALMGWARQGGDLRVAHFFATHGLHFIPVAGYLAAVRMEPAAARRTVWLAAIAWCGLVAFTFFQALAGRPFLAGLVG
ncbi:MAG: hypothetical protein KDJ48_06025 [Nitratireductor sp.]|nr:hypothetical protein [Nitratireductor sp.]